MATINVENAVGLIRRKKKLPPTVSWRMVLRRGLSGYEGDEKRKGKKK